MSDFVKVTNYKYDVFIGYSSKNKDWVCELKRKLESYGFTCFWDDDFMPGKPVIQNMLYGIENCKKTILVLSEAFIESGFCLYEMLMTVDKSNRLNQQCLIPLVLEKIEVPPCLSTINYVTVEAPNYEDKLKEAIKANNLPLMSHFSVMGNDEEYVPCPNQGCGGRYHMENEDAMHEHKITCRYTTFKCVYAPRGCGKVFIRKNEKDRTEHQTICYHGTDECQFCKAYISRSSFKSHVENCMYRKVTCIYGCLGIPYFHTVGPQYIHRQVCPKEKIECPNNECTEKVKRCSIMDHRSDCPYEALKCPYEPCKTTFLRRDKESHFNKCLYRLVKCENKVCSKMLISKDMDKHLNSCDYSIISCPNEPCPHNFYRNEKLLIEHHAQLECQHRMINKDKTGVKVSLNRPLSCDPKLLDCSNKALGCSEQFYLFNLFKEHEMQCQFRLVECSNPFCSEKVRHMDLKRHFCEKIVQDCPYCKEKNLILRHTKFEKVGCILQVSEIFGIRLEDDYHMTITNDQEHQCLYKLESCSLCHHRTPQIKYQDKSHDLDCPRKSNSCPNKDLGCTHCGTQSTMANHLKHECKFHLIKCENKGCDFSTLRQDFKYHIHECQHQLVSCNYSDYGCREILTKYDMKKHQQNCLSIPSINKK